MTALSFKLRDIVRCAFNLDAGKPLCLYLYHMTLLYFFNSVQVLYNPITSVTSCIEIVVNFEDNFKI